MIRIAADARCLNRPYRRGIGLLLSELVANSPDDIHWDLFSDRPDLPFHRPESGDFQIHFSKERSYRFATWEQLQLPWFAIRRKANLLLCPANSAPFFAPLKTICIVHDTLQWEPSDRDTQESSFYRDFVLPRSFSHSNAIVTVSEHSKSRIRSHWGDDLTPIVIPNGISEDFFADNYKHIDLSQFGLQRNARPFLTYFGGLMPRKRFDWALEAWKPFSDRCDLAACGIESDARGELLKHLSEKERSHVHFLPFVDAEYLPSLYSQSALVVYPTLYEGFGLPAIESQACGTPIALSPHSSLEALVGPLTIPLDVSSMDDWREAIERTLTTPPSESLRQNARQWARQFSWKSSSQTYYRLFHEIVESPQRLRDKS